jgi:pheromone shutdown protein TraB
MSSKLLKVAREHSSVVAVVGKGHVAGIKKHWEQPIQVTFSILFKFVKFLTTVYLLHLSTNRKFIFDFMSYP